MSKLILPIFALIILQISKQPSFATPFFTNPIAFGNAIAGENSFETNLSSFPASALVNTPLNISGNSLSVNATSAGDGLYSFGNELTISSENSLLIFTNFSPGLTAFGGFFFNIEQQDGIFSATNISMLVSFADLSFASYTSAPAASRSNFIGIVTSNQILSVSIATDGSLPATSQIIIGTAVPEPSAIALISLSVVGLVAYSIKRRFREID